MVTREEAAQLLVSQAPDFRLAEVEVSGIPMRVYLNAPRSLRSLLESTASFGEREFLVYESERWTYAEHFRIVAGLAHRWAAQGIGKGDRVAIAMRNYPEWAMSFWAAQALGAIVVPLNAWSTGPDLAYVIQDSQPKILVADGERIASLAGQLSTLALDRVIAVRAAGSPVTAGSRVVAWEDELGAAESHATLPQIDIDPDDDATILYTSGTTGYPKGAVGTHRNHLTNLRNTELNGAIELVIAGITAPADRPQLSILQVFPFFHIAGLSGLYVSTAIGAKLSLMYKWDTGRAMEMITREKINSAAMVPTLLRRLIEWTEDKDVSLPSMRGLSAGGAPVPPDLIERLEHRFKGQISAANGYGLTETTSAVAVNSGAEYFRHPDSVGRLVPGADLRVVDPEAGQDMPAGSIGELWFRGPNVVRGYWNNPAETAQAFTDGWFHSGDLGYVDPAGLIYVVDRLKDVIIRAGENVYCAEVEAALFEFPGVADVAVIGLPHVSLGEEVVALVALRPGSAEDPEALLKHAASRLAAFKVPSQVIFIDDEIPRTATGKVLKRQLRDRFAGVPGRSH
jgi:long-chain acyl-CoA synthetase